MSTLRSIRIKLILKLRRPELAMKFQRCKVAKKLPSHEYARILQEHELVKNVSFNVKLAKTKIFLIFVGLCSSTSIPVSVCGATEVWQQCASACEPTCENPYPKCSKECGPAKCQCAPGFVRDNTSGKCIAVTSCSGPPVCQVGEVFSTCSTKCEPTCQNPNPICIASCGPAKCQCAAGLVRNSSGKCVTPTSCSVNPVCQVGEVFSNCSAPCEPTCLEPKPTCVAIACGPPKCQCAPGFVRGSSGKCILPTSCSGPPVCQVGEVYSTCSTACEPTCLKPNPICIASCGPAKCQCAAGLVRNSSGKCVAPTSCSVNPVCQVGEVWMECASACEATCEKPNPLVCTLQCLPAACQCAPGFVRDKTTGKCILPTSCSVNPVCQAGEVYSNCSTPCEPTCLQPNPTCVAMCGPPKCQCAPGFVRDSSGKCILPTSCSGPPVCQVGEVYSTCSAICEPTCQNPNPICIKQCGSAKCECAPGLIRDQATGKCVLQASCSSTVPSCPVGEHWSQCSSHCESTCSNKNPICTKVCSPAKCACNTGLSRHPISGKCVSSELCPSAMNCGLNEEFSECGARCQATCDYRTGINRPQICPAICMPGCVCSAGHIRFGQVDGSGGVCLRENFCVSYYPKLFPDW
ncbi:unnamed protein product [Auanema sp. JU1783]|nr:unnamed protein product [Auanema sp. JU1783]